MKLEFEVSREQRKPLPFSRPTVNEIRLLALMECSAFIPIQKNDKSDGPVTPRLSLAANLSLEGNNDKRSSTDLIRIMQTTKTMSKADLKCLCRLFVIMTPTSDAQRDDMWAILKCLHKHDAKNKFPKEEPVSYVGVGAGGLWGWVGVGGGARGAGMGGGVLGWAGLGGSGPPPTFALPRSPVFGLAS